MPHSWTIHYFTDSAMDNEMSNRDVLIQVSDESLKRYMRSEMTKDSRIAVAVARRRDNIAIQIEVSR